MNSKVKVFISYVKEDEEVKDKLERFLFGLKQSDTIEVWNAQAVLAGGELAKEISRELHKADLILLIVSIDFINSGTIWRNELEVAMKRHESQEAKVIPIRARSADWGFMPFKGLQGLPADGKTISELPDKDKAYTEIAAAIKEVVDAIAERNKYKVMVFGNEKKTRDQLIFLSVGTPHTMAQAGYIKLLKEKFSNSSFQLVTLQDKDWDPEDPIGPIYKLMKKCVGCIVLLLERYYIDAGRIKRGSENEKPINGIALTTPWNQIEATLAYTEKLPLLILKDKNVYTDGVFVEYIKKFKQVKIDIENFGEWQQDDKAYIFEEFLEKVKAVKK